MYNAKIILDSVSSAGRRLTTWELTYPRFVHAELMTHRLFSRNAASGRAIPNEKVLICTEIDPVMPVFWGKNQKGMQAAEELSSEEIEKVKVVWLRLRDQAVAGSRELAALGLHKQLCNRVVEPWMFITVILSATSFDNWFHLRDHRQAQPEIAWVARKMHQLYIENQPKRLRVGQWHLPLVTPQDCEDAGFQVFMDGKDKEQIVELLKKVSVGRCARVSYLTHDGRRDLAEDVALHDKLLAGMSTDDPLHMSPFEHVAQALDDPNEQSGNFRGWRQYRKMIKGEHFGEVLP